MLYDMYMSHTMLSIVRQTGWPHGKVNMVGGWSQVLRPSQFHGFAQLKVENLAEAIRGSQHWLNYYINVSGCRPRYFHCIYFVGVVKRCFMFCVRLYGLGW